MPSLPASSLQRIFLASLCALCIYMLWPFLPHILTGGILAILTYPIVRNMNRFGLGQLGAAIATTVLTTIVLFLPLSILVFVGARTAAENLPLLVKNMNPQFFQNLIHNPDLMKAEAFVRHAFGFDPELLQDYAFDLTQQIGGRVAQEFGAFVARIPAVSLYFLVTILSLLYFLHIAPMIKGFAELHSPFDAARTRLLLKKFIAICNSLVLAALVIGVIQSILFGIVCLALRVPNVSVICLLVFLMSFIPMIGSAPFTFGFAIYYMLSGALLKGLIIALLASLIGLIDNLIRPIILRKSASMNPVIAILAILGGLNVFGFSGIFLGPLLVGLSIETYAMIYSDRG